jgi:hypothetical protein
MIHLLNSWKKDIKEKINDTNKGIVNVDGEKIRSNLLPYVQSRLEFMKKYLYNLMVVKSRETVETLEKYVENLKKQPATLAEYAKFIENLNESKEKKSVLEIERNDIDSMHTILRTKFDSNILTHYNTLELEKINETFEELKRRIEDAESYKKVNRDTMGQKLEKATQDLQRDINNIAGLVNSGKLVLEDVGKDQADKDLNLALKDINVVKSTLSEIKKNIDR